MKQVKNEHFCFWQTSNFGNMMLPQLPKAGGFSHYNHHQESNLRSSSHQTFEHLPTIRGWIDDYYCDCKLHGLFMFAFVNLTRFSRNTQTKFDIAFSFTTIFMDVKLFIISLNKFLYSKLSRWFIFHLSKYQKDFCYFVKH